MSYKGLN